MQTNSSTHSSDYPLPVISCSFLTSFLPAGWWEGSPARQARGRMPTRALNYSIILFCSILFSSVPFHPILSYFLFLVYSYSYSIPIHIPILSLSVIPTPILLFLSLSLFLFLFYSCLFYFQLGALSSSRVLTRRQETRHDWQMCQDYLGTVASQTSVRASAPPGEAAEALQQLGAHQGTSVLQSEEALPAPGGQLWPPSGHACRQLKGMTALKAFLIIPHNCCNSTKKPVDGGWLWQEGCTLPTWGATGGTFILPSSMVCPVLTHQWIIHRFSWGQLTFPLTQVFSSIER